MVKCKGCGQKIGFFASSRSCCEPVCTTGVYHSKCLNIPLQECPHCGDEFCSAHFEKHKKKCEFSEEGQSVNVLCVFKAEDDECCISGDYYIRCNPELCLIYQNNLIQGRNNQLLEIILELLKPKPQ
ncbi:MAG: hypothetical protein PHE43_03720 [Candidatus Nanoarchaeia archaeon]|nr:hypothetical protein [Candidatus Nanoarchaeia archaeon]